MSVTGGHPWRERQRPARLERRVEFEEYEVLRSFLDDVAALSEGSGIFPNLSFGRTYVNLTLFADDGEDSVGASQWEFARQVDELLGRSGE
jgi:pterin-4a-carbinolamine dehydratase